MMMFGPINIEICSSSIVDNYTKYDVLLSF